MAETLSKSDVIKEVFLSPRVIDREAFNDYSASLRRLIEESASQVEALKSAAAEAQAAQSALRETAARHQGRFENATKALTGIETKMTEADALMAAARDARQNLEALRAGAEKTVADRIAQLDGKIESIERRAEEHARRLESQSAQSIMNLIASAERKLAQVEQKLIEFKPRTSPAPAALPMPTPIPHAPIDTTRADAAASELRRLVSEAERQRELSASTLDATRVLSKNADERIGQLRSLSQQTETAKSMLMDAINQAAGRIDELLDKADGVRRTADAVGPACELAEAQAGDTLRRIEESSAAAKTIVTEARAVVTRMSLLLEQLQPWAPLLLHGDHADLPPQLAAFVDQAKLHIGREAASVAHALQEASARMNALSGRR